MLELIWEGFLKGGLFIRANLRGANLREANLEEADLEEAYLGGAYLGGAYLRGAKNGTPIESQSVAIRLMLMKINISAEVFVTLYNGICWEDARKKIKLTKKLRGQIKKTWPELIEKFEEK